MYGIGIVCRGLTCGEGGVYDGIKALHLFKFMKEQEKEESDDRI